jgi:hypothetical protein
MATPVTQETTLRDALAVYFDENGFGADGGYTSSWVDFKLGPIPFPFPNTAARKRAVRYHDLHHVVTGYRTDFFGELEISAWEIGSGCRDFVAAWQLNLSGLAGGVFFRPRRTFEAFVRGRESENFYGRVYDEALLQTTVSRAKEDLRVNVPVRAATLLDAVLFALAASVGLVLGLTFFALFLPIALVALPVLRFLARKSRRRSYETSRTHSAAT